MALVANTQTVKSASAISEKRQLPETCIFDTTRPYLYLDADDNNDQGRLSAALVHQIVLAKTDGK